jgi:predicted transposase YbfD/YdcC
MKKIKKRWIGFIVICVVLFAGIFYVRAVMFDFIAQNTSEKKEHLEQYNEGANYFAEFDIKKQQEFYDLLKQTSFKFIPNGLDYKINVMEPNLAGNAGLDLHNLDIADADLKPLISIPVVWINLSGTQITDDGLKILAEIKSLKYLYLNATALSGKPTKKISDASIPFIAKMKKLEVLELIGSDITDKTIIAIAENCKKIRHLGVGGPCIDGSGFKAFSSDTLLEYVDCGGQKVDDKSIKYLAQMKNLKVVDFSFSNVTDKGLMLFTRSPKINRIGVECSAVTKRGVNKFIKKRKDVFIRIGMGIKD